MFLGVKVVDEKGERDYLFGAENGWSKGCRVRDLVFFDLK